MTDEYSQTYWDDRYASKEQWWSGNPNATLVQECSGLPPGRSLDVGCGEGADTLWLASRGWTASGADVSQVAVERCRAKAADAGLTATFEQVDIRDWTPPTDTYDLVHAHFMHFPPDIRTPLFEAMAAAVVPGGSILIVGHHPKDTEHRAHGRADSYYGPEELAALLPGWEVVTSDAREREHPNGMTVHDTVFRARRG